MVASSLRATGESRRRWSPVIALQRVCANPSTEGQRHPQRRAMTVLAGARESLDKTSSSLGALPRHLSRCFAKQEGPRQALRRGPSFLAGFLASAARAPGAASPQLRGGGARVEGVDDKQPGRALEDGDDAVLAVGADDEPVTFGMDRVCLAERG